ncbi:MAG: CoA transferase, partial [Candidatus Poribacteria bacterium]|nr:CoA transferase [Candidatus Poribacteria bacterium]
MSEAPQIVNSRPPLAGVRIISVEQFGAGPWGTMMLADLGAEIIKIENPETQGDVARYVPPYTIEQDSVYFQSFNRNKKSITLNLRHPRAKEVLHPLVEISDGVFNNLRGDLSAKLGLDYPALWQVKPSIVCCSLSAFGRTGARASEPGYDYLMQGYAG